MRILLIALFASVVAACGATPKAYVPVDSPLKPWTPSAEAEVQEEVSPQAETTTEAPAP
jgi:hypothetical protein